MARRKGDPEDEVDAAHSSVHELYPKGRKGGVVVRIRTDYSRGRALLRYWLALIDTRGTVVDEDRVIGYHNGHGHHHRHGDGKVETVEFESYESMEKHFEAKVREYLEGRKGYPGRQDSHRSRVGGSLFLAHADEGSTARSRREAGAGADRIVRGSG